MTKVIRHFRIEKEKWDLFKKQTSYISKPTRTLREFVEWYLKYRDIWSSFKYLFDTYPSCFLCGKEIQTEVKDKEQRSLSALENGFKIFLIVSKSNNSYQTFKTERKWVCDTCFQKIKTMEVQNTQMLY